MENTVIYWHPIFKRLAMTWIKWPGIGIKVLIIVSFSARLKATSCGRNWIIVVQITRPFFTCNAISSIKLRNDPSLKLTTGIRWGKRETAAHKTTWGHFRPRNRQTISWLRREIDPTCREKWSNDHTANQHFPFKVAPGEAINTIHVGHFPLEHRSEVNAQSWLVSWYHVIPRGIH